MPRYNENKNEIYVELKGSDIPRAVEQLKSTICHVSNPVSQKLCHVVFSGKPRFSTAVENSKKELLRQYKAKLEVTKRGKTFPLP